MVWEFQPTPIPNKPYAGLPAIDDKGIDIRAEFARMMTDHGHTVFLRVPTGQLCACRATQDDPVHPNPDDEFEVSCPTCQGFGYHYRDLPVRAYRRPAYGTFGFNGAIQRTQVGVGGVSDLVWYFQHTQRVDVGTHIIEVTDDDAGLPIKAYNIERIHEVKQAHITRDRTGRTEFWEVLSREVLFGK
jgi:hypothetical protein